MRHGPNWARHIIGDWHTHVGRSATPSDVDLRGFVAGLRRVEAAGGNCYLGLIAVQRDGRMQLVGYVLSRDRDGFVDLDTIAV